ncbi:MAG: LppX_LprAFG lipoprotein [Dehalococcoidia bacterium]
MSPSFLRSIRVAMLAALVVGLVTAACGSDEAFDVSDVDAADVLDRSAERMEALSSFAFEVQHENGATAIVGGIQMVSATGAVQGTDRMQLDIQARFANTNIETGIVILPGEGYLQNPITGRWQRQGGMDISEFFDPARGVTGLMRGTSSVEVVAGDTVDGVSTYVLEAQLDSGDLGVFVGNAPAGREVTARIWIGMDDLLVRRIEVNGPLTPGDAENVVRRLILRDFDSVVEITAPQ